MDKEHTVGLFTSEIQEAALLLWVGVCVTQHTFKVSKQTALKEPGRKGKKKSYKMQIHLMKYSYTRNIITY